MEGNGGTRRVRERYIPARANDPRSIRIARNVRLHQANDLRDSHSIIENAP